MRTAQVLGKKEETLCELLVCYDYTLLSLYLCTGSQAVQCLTMYVHVLAWML